jgi:hypothetical protein
MPRFTFTQPEFGQKSLDLPDGAFSVGRSRGNQIIIEDASVSKEHAELLVYGNEIIVRERGSRNGIFVSGVRIEAQSAVKHGEKIRFGRVELLLALETPEVEGPTEITTLACFARIKEEATALSGTPLQFPVRFSPETAAHGLTTVASLSGEPPQPTFPVHCPNPPPSNPSGGLRGWIWRLIGVGALLLAASWLLKR